MTDLIKIHHAKVKKHPIFDSYGATETCASTTSIQKSLLLKVTETSILNLIMRIVYTFIKYLYLFGNVFTDLCQNIVRLKIL